jgi:hypothetical protein
MITIENVYGGKGMKIQKITVICIALIITFVFPVVASAYSEPVQIAEPVQKYTVTFLAGDHGKFDSEGSSVTQEVEAGAAAKAPKVIPAEGYDFTGWNASFGNINSDLTITAQYEIKTFVVTFYVGDHGSMSVDTNVELVQVINYGESAKAPGIDPDTGYEFIGWDKIFVNVTKDIEVTAKYAKIKYNLKVKIEGEGSVSGIAGKYAYNTKVALSSDNAKPDDGYQFDKFTDSDGKTITSVNMKGNRTIIACFSAISVNTAAPSSLAPSDPATTIPSSPTPSSIASISSAGDDVIEIPEEEVAQAGNLLVQQQAGFSLYWLILIIGLPLSSLIIICLVRKRKASENK